MMTGASLTHMVMVLTRHDRFLWASDRAANSMVIVDTTDDTVVNECLSYNYNSSNWNYQQINYGKYKKKY